MNRAASTEDLRARSLHRFLGIAVDAEPRTVLALDSGELTVGRIEEATRRRWRQVVEHPAAGDPEAQFAKNAIVAAAEALLGRPPGIDAEAERSPLDAIDRAIIDALRASHGLNHEAALRLAALARRSELTAEAILQRVRELVRGKRLGRFDRRFDRWPRRRRLASGGGVQGELVKLLAEVETVVEADRAASERPSAWRTAASVAMVLGLLVLAMSLPWILSDPPAEIVVADRGSAATAPAPIEPAIESEPSEAVVPSAEVPVPVLTAVPFVLSPALDREAWSSGRLETSEEPAVAEAAAASVELAPRLLDLAEQIRGGRGQLDETMREVWAALQEQAGLAWIRLDPAARDAILDASAECFAAVETPSSAFDLLDGLGSDNCGADAGSLLRSTWRAALLADLALRGGLMTTVRDRVLEAVDRMPLPPRVGWTAPSAFDETAARWLAHCVRGLADSDPNALSRWRAWFAATAALEPRSLQQRADLEALKRTLSSWRPGDERTRRPEVLAAIVARLDAGELPEPAVALEAVRGLLGPGGVVRDGGAAWVLSSLWRDEADFAWMPVVPIEAGKTERALWLAELEAGWPAPRPRLPRADVEVVARAERLLEQLRQRLPRSRAARLEMLANLGRVHEGLLVARFDPRRAGERFDAVEVSLRQPREASVDPPVAAGRALLEDGRFAEAMRQAINDREGRIALLRSLRSDSGGDLGPEDAKAFARAVLRDAPEVRHAATAVLLEALASGPGVLTAIVDLSPGLERDPDVIRLAERLSARSIPTSEGDESVMAVRAALIAAALDAMPSEARRVDALAATYADTLARRAALGFEWSEAPMAPGAGLPPEMRREVETTSDPVAAAAAVAERSREAIESSGGVVDAEEVGRRARRGELRRGAAASPMQRLVAELATAAEWQQLAAMIRLAGDSEELGELATAAARRRAAADTGLDQAIEVERFLCELAIWIEAHSRSSS